MLSVALNLTYLISLFLAKNCKHACCKLLRNTCQDQPHARGISSNYSHLNRIIDYCIYRTTTTAPYAAVRLSCRCKLEANSISAAFDVRQRAVSERPLTRNFLQLTIDLHSSERRCGTVHECAFSQMFHGCCNRCRSGHQIDQLYTYRRMH